MLIPVEIGSFAIDQRSNMPLIVLREVAGARAVAVPISIVAAKTIAMHMAEVLSDKPEAIDLVKIVLDQLGGTLQRVIINDVTEDAFSANIVIGTGASLAMIDCLPVDAVILAMKCGAPIFVKEFIFKKLNPGADNGLSEKEQLKNCVRTTDVTEFGRYILEA